MTPRSASPPGVGISVVVIDAGHVLLTLRSDFEAWCTPGGRVEFGESLRDAAAREFREETGIEATIGELIGVYSILGGVPNSHAFAFTGTVAGKRVDRGATDDEVLDLDWFPIDELPEPMVWWQEDRIRDAHAGRRRVTRTHRVMSRSDSRSRRDLYEARDRSGLSRADFFRWNFPRPD